METSPGSTRKSTTNEPDEGQDGHENRRQVGGLDVQVDTMDCVYLDVDTCGEMNATTVHEIIAMTAEEYSNLKNVKPKVGEHPAVESKPVAA